MRRLVTATLALALAAPLAAQERGLVANMGNCSSRAPRLWIAVDGASATDCSSGGGSSQVLCLCSGGAWAAVGGGGLSAPRQISFNNPPASPHAYDCEFGSLCSGWSLYTANTAMDAGTVSPISTATGNPKYDFATRPGWMLFQSDETNVVVSGVKRASMTMATQATYFAHINTMLRDMGASEGEIGFGLFNSGDANEWIYMGLSSGVGSLTGYVGKQDNGSTSYALRAWPGDLQYGTGDFYCAIVKDTNRYHFWIWTADNGFAHYLGYYDKTGVTTFDEVRVYIVSSDDTPRHIYGIDFFRYYASATFALSNP